MKWKDILFFNKKDKIAITILLCFSLILYSGYAIYPYIKADSKHPDDALVEFTDFQKNLKPTYYSKQTTDVPSTLIQQPINKNKLIEGQRIDINSANENALKKVPGIGDTFAKRIIEHRSSLGGFTNIEQLMEVKGISEKKFGKISNFFIIEKQLKKQPLNKLIEKNHPYFNEEQISSINKYTRNGRKITSIETLNSLEHFTPRDIERIEKYIQFK